MLRLNAAFLSKSAVERSFSINKECLVENLEESLCAQRIVYDAIRSDYNFNLDNLDITSMLQHLKNAGTKRNQCLKRKREQKEDEDKLKVNMNQELFILKAKKKRLMET